MDLNASPLPEEDEEEERVETAVETLRREVEVENEAMTNDDVLGDAIPLAQQTEMQKICCMTLGVQPQANSHFPGSQPVSLDREAAAESLRELCIAAAPHLASACALAALMQACESALCTPAGISTGSEHANYLLVIQGLAAVAAALPSVEAEAALAKLTASAVSTIQGLCSVKLPFYERWKLIEKEIIEPRTHDIKTNTQYRYDMEAVRVRRKDFWMLSAVGKVLRDFIPKLSHEADGLIFQLEGHSSLFSFLTNLTVMNMKHNNMRNISSWLVGSAQYGVLSTEAQVHKICWYQSDIEPKQVSCQVECKCAALVVWLVH